MDVKTCTYLTPRAIPLVADELLGATKDSYPILNVTTIDTTIESEETPTNLILTFAILRMQLPYGFDMKDAFECSLTWCVKGYNDVSTTFGLSLDYEAVNESGIAVRPGSSGYLGSQNDENNDTYNSGPDSLRWLLTYVALDLANDTRKYKSVPHMA